VLVEKNDSGQTRTCIQRATFIIDKIGTLRHAIYGVNPRGHCAEVLDLVKGMSAGGAI
jgi:peroxiredoxin Q/BCP